MVVIVVVVVVVVVVVAVVVVADISIQIFQLVSDWHLYHLDLPGDADC